MNPLIKILVLHLILLTGIEALSQQKEKFDYASYTAPAGWIKGTDIKNVVTYLTTNKLAGTYCRIAIYSSTTSKGNLQADFESEWQALIIKNLNPTDNPNVVLNTSENGWEVAPFQFSGAQLSLRS